MNNYKNEQILEEIMQAIESGASVTLLEQRFPEQKEVISEIMKTRGVLSEVGLAIPSPVTKVKLSRIVKVEGLGITSFINNLTLSMNYKIAVPVLVFGVVAVGGSMLLSGHKVEKEVPLANNTEVTNNRDTSSPNVTVEDTRDVTENSDVKSDANTAETKPVNNNSTNNNQVAVADSGLDDVLAGFAVDATNEQTTAADDGVTDDMFAEGELSDFEIDDYVY